MTHSVVFSAATAAQQCHAKLVIIVTSSGATALAKSNQRDFIPTAAATSHPETLTRMTLFWGILPLRGVPVGDPRQVCQTIDVWGKSQAGLQTGDRVVIVMGTGVGSSAHNMLMVHEVQ